MKLKEETRQKSSEVYSTPKHAGLVHRFSVTSFVLEKTSPKRTCEGIHKEREGTRETGETTDTS